MVFFIRAILLASIFFVTSCQKKHEHNKNSLSLQINIVSEPESLDPRKSRSLNAIIVSKALFEGLTRLTEKGPELAIANSYECLDEGKKYIFHLRESFWTNGDPVTSYDFAYSWKKILDPKFPSSTSFYLFCIQGAKEAKENAIPLDQVAIDTPDANTLIVTLNNPTEYFLELLALPPYFPVNKTIDTTTNNWTESPKTFISNGPFSIEKWKHHDVLLLKKNLNYWDKKTVQLEKINFMMVSEETELSLYEKGEIDWCGSPCSVLPIDALQTLKARKDFFTAPYLGTHFLRVNTQKDENTISLRQALNASINKADITDHVLQGNQIPAKGLLPTTFTSLEAPTNSHEIKKETFNNFPPITISYANQPHKHLIAQAIQQHWESSLPIKVHLEALEPKILISKISSGNYDLALGSWFADFNDPISFLDVFKYKTASTNNTFWENPQYIELLSQSTTTFNKETRQKLLEKAHNILINDMPIIPLFHPNMLFLKKDHVKNVFLSPLGHIDFKWTTIN